MPARQDDDLAWRAGGSGSSATAVPPTPPSRSLPLGVAVALAVAATLVAVLTDDAGVLRACVVVAAWAGVGSAYVAVRQLAERRAAAGRESELRRAYDRELDLADADHREHQLRLSNEVRQKADEALRQELGQLREQSAELARLREQLARVSGLGDSLAGLARLREDVAALGALRADVAALGRVREDVGQLGGLREELAALRAQLAESIDAEMLVERILLRTRGSRAAERAPGEPAGTAEVAWTEEPPPRELTGGWPAVRLDQPPVTRAYEAVGREQAWEPATVERSTVAPEPAPTERPRYGDRDWDPLSDPLPDALLDDRGRHGRGPDSGPGPQEDRGYDDDRRYDDDRGYGDDRYDPQAWRAELERPPAASPSPLEWLADHALLDPHDQPWTTPTRAVPVAGATSSAAGTPVWSRAEPEEPSTGPVGAQRPRPVPHRRRHGDEAGGPPTDPALAATAEHPAHRAGQRPPAGPPSDRPPVPARPVRPQPDTAGHSRLSEILAETPAAPDGGRRRRRYRDDDETDDVLSRVLRGE